MTRLPFCSTCGTSIQEAREREIVASKILADTLPNLAKIRWDTLFLPLAEKRKKCTEGEEDGFYFRDEEESVTVSGLPCACVLVFDRRDGEAKLVKECRF